MEMEREEEIRGLANKIWEQEGYPQGHDIEHWLYAEAIWQEKHRPKSKIKQSKPPKRTKSRKTAAGETEL